MRVNVKVRLTVEHEEVIEIPDEAFIPDLPIEEHPICLEAVDIVVDNAFHRFDLPGEGTEVEYTIEEE